MSKKFTRILSVVLLVAMMLSMSVFASAEETEYKQFNKILAFGDSVGQAWGTSGWGDDCYFPNYVADALGIGSRYSSNVSAKGFLNYGRFKGNIPQFDTSEIEDTDRIFCCETGVRATEMLIALGAAQKDASDPYYGSVSCDTDLLSDFLTKNTDYYVEAVRQSDLIILECGSDDVMYYAQELSGLRDVFADIGSMGAEDIAAFLTNYGELLLQGYSNFYRDFPKVIEKIKEIKGNDTDYEIVVVSVYNPVNGTKITNDIDLPIGDIAAPVITLMNQNFKDWSKTYGFKYADITNVPTASMTDDMTLMEDFGSGTDACIATHPKYTVGYEYIGNQILDQLVAEKAPVDTNIRVNLGSITEVSSVTVGSRTLSKSMYSFDPETHILTIQNGTTLASSLTVITKNGSKLGLQVYELKFHADNGYNAYLAYQNNNMSRTAVNVLKILGTITSSLAKTISGFFGK